MNGAGFGAPPSDQLKSQSMAIVRPLCISRPSCCPPPQKRSSLSLASVWRQTGLAAAAVKNASGAASSRIFRPRHVKTAIVSFALSKRTVRSDVRKVNAPSLSSKSTSASSSM